MRRPLKPLPSKRRPPKHPQLPNGSRGHEPGRQRGDVVEHASKVMLAQRRAWVLQVATSGLVLSRIIDAAPNARNRDGVPIPMDPSEVTAIYKSILAEMHARWPEDLANARVAQIARLHNDIFTILQGEVREFMHKGIIVQGSRRINWAAKLQCESQIALIYGTHAPKVIELDVDVDITGVQSTIQIMKSMTAEEFARNVEEAKELEADALVGRALKLVK